MVTVFLAVFPIESRVCARLIGTLFHDRPDRPEALTFDDVSGGALGQLRLDVEKVNWFSTYRVHHLVAEAFRDGRVFLLGDARHVHSSAGGQGMNTGIGDAINLACKLAAVVGGAAGPDLLDSYEAERRSFARCLVSTTDRVFTLATSGSRLAQIWRTRIAPIVVPLLNRVPAIRRFNFQTMSQIAVQYRSGPLAGGRAGRIRGGDRLPCVEDGKTDNFTPLRAIAWQVHVYGDARPALRDWCGAERLPLHVFRWCRAHARAGFRRDAAYLIRPDTYVAFAERHGDPGAIDRLLHARGLARRASRPSPFGVTAGADWPAI